MYQQRFVVTSLLTLRKYKECIVDTWMGEAISARYRFSTVRLILFSITLIDYRAEEKRAPFLATDILRGFTLIPSHLFRTIRQNEGE